MKSRLTAIVLLLLCLPIAAWCVAGAFWLVDRGLFLLAVLSSLVLWALAGVLVWRRLRETTRPFPPEAQAEKDEQAWELVQSFEQRLQEMPSEQRHDRETLERLAYELAGALARHYYPGAPDPLAPLTPADLLSAIRRATDEADQWLAYYLPGGREMTIHRWRQFGRLPALIQSAGRWLTRRLPWLEKRGPSRPVSGAHRAMLNLIGRHLIALYSGGTEEADQTPRRPDAIARAAARTPPAPAVAAEQSHPIEQVTVVFIGPIRSGKSTLIRGLLGPGRAATDRDPRHRSVIRHRVQLGHPPARLSLLEYSCRGQTDSPPLHWLLSVADLVLLVADAREEVDPELHPQGTAAHLEAMLELSPDVPLFVVLTKEGGPPEAGGPADEFTGDRFRHPCESWIERFGDRIAGCLAIGDFPDGAVLEDRLELVAAAITEHLPHAKAAVFREAIDRGEDAMVHPRNAPSAS